MTWFPPNIKSLFPISQSVAKGRKWGRSPPSLSQDRWHCLRAALKSPSPFSSSEETMKGMGQEKRPLLGGFNSQGGSDRKIWKGIKKSRQFFISHQDRYVGLIVFWLYFEDFMVKFGIINNVLSSQFWIMATLSQVFQVENTQKCFTIPLF